jgi:hypothetical protein
MKYVENHAFHYRKTKIKGFESDDMNMHWNIVVMILNSKFSSV